MSRIAPTVRGIRRGGFRPAGLLTPASARGLAARATRIGTSGLIAPGPGFVLPRLGEPLWHFSPQRSDGAMFAANLLRSGVADPNDWETTRDVGGFLQRSLERFVGTRAKEIDLAFDIAFMLSPSLSSWHRPEETDPRRIMLTFRVASSVGWVNLTPALELLESENELLSTIFYHWLDESLCRWFRVFNIAEAKWSWESWVERRAEDEEERKAECDKEGTPFEALEAVKEPCLPRCIGRKPKRRVADVKHLARSEKGLALMEAAERLNRTATSAECPMLNPGDMEDMFPDRDQPIPLVCLAFGEHDIVTEMLSMELDVSGQVEPEPWPIIQMDGTDPASIQRAFQVADVVLDTLVAAARTLLLVPDFEPNNKHSFGA